MKKERTARVIYIVTVSVVFLVLSILMLTSVIGFSPEEIEGRGLFDAKLTYYNGDYFYETLDLMTKEDMNIYLVFHICDYIYLFSYMLLMIIVTEPITPKKLQKLIYVLCGLPAFFDIIENISIDVLIVLYPTHSAYGAAVGVWSCLKWYFGALWFAVFIAFAAIYAVKKVKNSKTEDKELLELLEQLDASENNTSTDNDDDTEVNN